MAWSSYGFNVSEFAWVVMEMNDGGLLATCLQNTFLRHPFCSCEAMAMAYYFIQTWSQFEEPMAQNNLGVGSFLKWCLGIKKSELEHGVSLLHTHDLAL